MEKRYRKRIRKEYGGVSEVLRRDAEVISSENHALDDLSDNAESSPFPHSEEDFSYDNIRP